MVLLDAGSPVQQVSFIRDKYGPELFLDAHRDRREPMYSTRKPHRLDYWEIQLVTDGAGQARVGSHCVELGVGRILFSAPFEQRVLDRAPSTESFLLCFTGKALEGWGDPYLLHRLACLRADSPTPLLALEDRTRLWLEDRLSAMEEELAICDERTGSVLTAMLVEVLQRLDRAYCSAVSTHARNCQSLRVGRFLDLVERHFRETRRVADYAAMMAVSPTYLAHLVRRDLGLPPKKLLDRRVVLEAKRLLLSTEQSVAEIASQLGFEDASYFSRFFNTRAGTRPRAFRDRSVRRRG